MYQVDGIKEWLMGEGLCDRGLWAALQYAMQGDGERREELVKACQRKCQNNLDNDLDEVSLHEVDAYTLCHELAAHASVGCGSFGRGIARYRLFERWARANKVGKYIDCDANGKAVMNELAKAVKLYDLPSDLLDGDVKMSGLVSAEALEAALQEREREEREAREVDSVKYEVIRACDVKFRDISCVAVSRESVGQRVAVCEQNTSSVHVFDLESGRFLMKLTRGGYGLPRSKQVCGMAFNKSCELILSDAALNCVKVFDNKGVHMRTFGRKGEGNGEFNSPSGIAVNDKGHIIVCDRDNRRVQVFQEDGTFKFKFGLCPSKPQVFEPFAIAVGYDGTLVVQGDHNLLPSLHVFDRSGKHMTTIIPPENGQGMVSDFSFGARGEILLYQSTQILVYTSQGHYVNKIDLVARPDKWNNLITFVVDVCGRAYMLQEFQELRDEDGCCYGVADYMPHDSLRIVELAKTKGS